MEFFKKKGLIAALFAASLLFLACGDDDPEVSFIAVTDITLARTSVGVNTPLVLGATVVPATATNTNVSWTISNAGATGAELKGDTLTAEAQGSVTVTATIVNGKAQGENFTKNFTITITPPATDIGVSARVYAFDEGGNQVMITSEGPANGAFSSSEESMLKVLGTGKMVAAFDALLASTTPGGGDYYATIATPFLDNNGTAVEVNLSGLQSVRITGRLKGALRIVIESPAVTNWAQYGWEIGGQAEMDWDDIDVTLNVADMSGPAWGVPNADLEACMARATNFTLNLVTGGTLSGTRVDFEIDRIELNFAEGTVPAGFGEGSNTVLLDDFERRPNDFQVDDWTNQNALSLRGVENAGTWYAYASDNRPDRE
jgi:hypothetical protein